MRNYTKDRYVASVFTLPCIRPKGMYSDLKQKIIALFFSLHVLTDLVYPILEAYFTKQGTAS